MSGSFRNRRAVVHIGLEKTGSTSIQYMLNENRNRLRTAGFLFPQTPGPINHTRLVAACLDSGVVDNIKAQLLAYRCESESALRSNFEHAFKSELEEAGDWTTLIVSSELISSRLHTRSEVERLLGLLDPYVDEISVLVFLRRQDRLALSRFSSALRAGHADFEGVFDDLSANSFLHLPAERSANDMMEFFDYDRIISRFEHLGGKVSVKVELYDPPGGACDPVRVFHAYLGPSVPALDPEQEAMRLNPAMSAEAQYVISRLNAVHSVLFPSGERNSAYRSLLRQIEAEVAGKQCRTVARCAAEAFFSHFRDSNERVRARYFPAQATLFDEDFSSYPEAVDYGALERETDSLVRKYLGLAADLPGREGSWLRVRRRLRGFIRTCRFKS